MSEQVGTSVETSAGRSADTSADSALTVSQVAALAGVTVRTLHHYDAIGLLSPSARSDAAYRLYGHEDLERLQEILYFRELGVPLGDIATLLSGGALDRHAALELQLDLLKGKAARLGALVASLERAIDAESKGTQMSTDEMFGAFGDFDPAEYEDEVQERWGDTDAYKESARRTARYTKADWERFKAESEASTLALAEALDAGIPADDPRAMDAAERARLLIDTWFYPCSREMHRALGDMYVADARFTATYEKIRPGLARYVRDAIAANAGRER